MAAEDETLRRLVMDLRLLEGTLEEIQSRLNMLDSGLLELRMATTALESMKSEKPGSHLLVPIGGGSYAKAQVSDSEKVIVGIGAGVAVEKTVEAAKESIVKQLQELERVRISIQQQQAQVMQRMDGIRAKINEMSSKLTEGEGKGV